MNSLLLNLGTCQIKDHLYCVPLFSVQKLLPQAKQYFTSSHFSLQTNYYTTMTRSICALCKNITNTKGARDYLSVPSVQMQNASEQILADFSSTSKLILLSQKPPHCGQTGPHVPLPFSVQTLSHEELAFGASTNCWPRPSDDGAPAPLTPPFFGFVLIPSKRRTNLASSP